ncbi:hypothetical protein [Maribacter aquivivus]|uniref:hypothetical protein n=1 Tax=Maribacter aquivivus TaxID=228958 RepID=UPI0024900DEA|nr:hypothetical protein [Maribacter aquivivus]
MSQRLISCLLTNKKIRSFLLHFKEHHDDRNKNKIINKITDFHKSNKGDQLNIINGNLLKLLGHAKSTTQFYNQSLENIDLKNFSLEKFKSIPLLNKEIINSNFESLVSNNFNISNLNERYTGGSTGNPLRLLSDKKADLIDRAHHIYLYKQFGYKKGDIILGCSGRKISEEDRNNSIYWSNSTANDVFGEITFSTSYINDNNIKYYVKEMIRLQPKVIRSYPTFLNRISKYIIDNEIKIKFVIKGIVLTSEVCLPQQIENIKIAFNTEVYLEYGNREICMFSCTNDDSYIYSTSPYYCYMEVLNEDGSDTEIGHIGKVVTTSLINYGMPFIRYDTGDYAKVHYRNSGFLKLSEILGRKSDFIIDSNHKKVYLLDTIYRADFKILNKIKSWQLHQKEIGKVDILIISDDKLTITEENDLKNVFDLNTQFQFNFKYVNEIPKTPLGKQPFVIKDFKF